MSKISQLLDEFDRGSSSYLKLQPGKTITARMMPHYEKADCREAKKQGASLSRKSGILVYHGHEFLPKLDADKEDQRTNYRCLRDLHKPCGFCDFFDALGESDKSIRARHGRRARAVSDWWLPKTGEVKRWYYGRTVLERIDEIFDLYPNINSEIKGRDLLLTRIGQKLDTKYKIKVTSHIRPLEIENDLPNVIDLLGSIIVPTPKQIRQVLKEAFEND